MKINLITQDEYNTLTGIQEKQPTLTYQQKGYDEIDPKKLSDRDKESILTIEDILHRSIHGFRRFQNFTITNSGETKIRFQYDYNYNGEGVPFTGVGYIKVSELLNGFENNDKA